MSGESRIVSGAMNKVMMGMLNATPDSMNAANMADNVSPSSKDEEDKRRSSDHPASQQEREMIREKSGKQVGDKK